MKVGDRVSVSYHDMGKMHHAASINVTRRLRRSNTCSRADGQSHVRARLRTKAGCQLFPRQQSRKIFLRFDENLLRPGESRP